jgi:hypothetical protein
MASQYFKNFPLVYYKNRKLRNIMLKTNIAKDIFLSDTTFYTYEVKDGEKPSIVAFNYYGSVDFTWLVLLSNQIIDPYFEWVMSNEEFDLYLAKKYGSIESAQGTIVEYRDATNKTVTLDTYNYFALVNPDINANMTPVYAYDKEFEVNEQKRNIQLIDAVYAEQIAIELEKSLA